MSTQARAKAASETVAMIVLLNGRAAASSSSELSGKQRALAADMDAFLARTETQARIPNLQKQVRRRYQSAPIVAMQLTYQNALALAADPAVNAIVEDRVREAHLLESTAVVRAPVAWQSGQEGYGSSIAVLDTGVDHQHAMFAGKIVGSACFSTSGFGLVSVCPNGLEEQAGGNAGDDCEWTNAEGCEHGTHVAGIAAGRPIQLGAVNLRGVAPSAGVVAVQVFSRRISDNRMVSLESDQLAALDWLLPQVNSLRLSAVNISLGDDVPRGACDSDPMKPYIDQLRALGVITVISSGNDGSATGVSAPACITSALTVGATNNSDVVAAFSNSSSVIDLVAPGVSVTSAVPYFREEASDLVNVLSGTSMSAPHVAGAIAVLKAAKPTALAAEIEAALLASGKPVLDSRNQLVRPRLDVAAALAALGVGQPVPRLAVSPDAHVSFRRIFENGITIPEAHVYTVSNPNSVSITASLSAAPAGIVTMSGAGQSNQTELEFSLSPGASQTVTVRPAAAVLPFGVANAELSFGVLGGAKIARSASVIVENPLRVAPDHNTALVGPVGGPFRGVDLLQEPGTGRFNVSNIGGANATVGVAADQPWVSLAADGQTGQVITFLADSTHNEVTVRAIGAALTFPRGIYRATATFDANGRRAASRPLELRVTERNDVFENALPLLQKPGQPDAGILRGTGNNTFAFYERHERFYIADAARRTMWYTFTSTGGPTVVDTIGSSIDTILGVFVGQSVDNLSLVDINDDAQGLGMQSRISFNATAGMTYHIAVDGFAGPAQQGEFVVNVTPQPIANDLQANAQLLTGPGGSVRGSTAGATRSADELPHNGRPEGRSVWYRWIAPASNATDFMTADADHDTTLSIYSIAADGALVEVGSNDNIPLYTTSRVFFSAVQGQMYYVVVDAASAAAAGVFDLRWSQMATPSPLLASTLPSSRRTTRNRAVTIFANMLNTGSTTLSNCSVLAPRSFVGPFSYQAANAANQLIGGPNTPVTLAPGAIQNFVLTVQSAQTLDAGELGLVFGCDWTTPAPAFLGTNTWLLRVDPGASTPDVVAIGATIGTPGVVVVPQGGAAAFSVAAMNIGSAPPPSSMRFEASAPDPNLTLSVCETNPANGACLATPVASATISGFAANSVKTFSVFVQHQGPPAPFDPARLRIRAVFKDAAGNIYGSTSVAVRTQ